MSTVASSSLLWVAVLVLVLFPIGATVVILRRLRKRREEARDAGGVPILGGLPPVPAPHVVLNRTLSPSFGGGSAALSAAALGHGNQTTNAAFHTTKPVYRGGMDGYAVPRPLSLVPSAATEAGLAEPPTAALVVVPPKVIRRSNKKSMKDLGLPPPAFQRPPSFGDVGNDEYVSTEATGGISVPPTRHGTEAPNPMPDYAAVDYADVDVDCDDLPDYAAPDNRNEYAVPVATATSFSTSPSPSFDADHIHPHHGELLGGSSDMYALPDCQDTLAGTDRSNAYLVPETKNADYTYAHSAGVGAGPPEYMVPSTHNPDYTPMATADAEYADVDYTDVPGSSADPGLRPAETPDALHLPQHHAAIVSIGAHLASGSPNHLGPQHHFADHLADHTYEYCEPKLVLEQASGSAAGGNDNNMSRM